MFSDTRASGLRSKPRVGFRGGRMFRLRPRIRFARPASPRPPPDIPPPRVSTGGHPNPPNPRSARPGGRAHRLGGRGRRLGGREHAHRRGRRRSRRIGLPRASRQARFMAVKKEPLRSGGRIGRRCMPGGWGGAGEAGGGLGGAQFSSCPGNGTSNPGTDQMLSAALYLRVRTQFNFEPPPRVYARATALHVPALLVLVIRGHCP